MGKAVNSANWYASVFNAISAGIFIYSEGGALIDINPAGCKMHQRTREEMLHLSPEEFIHPDSYPVFEEFMASCVPERDRDPLRALGQRDRLQHRPEQLGVPIELQRELHLGARQAVEPGQKMLRMAAHRRESTRTEREGSMGNECV